MKRFELKSRDFDLSTQPTRNFEQRTRLYERPTKSSGQKKKHSNMKWKNGKVRNVRFMCQIPSVTISLQAAPSSPKKSTENTEQRLSAVLRTIDSMH
jgi:hypothetical protein